MAHYRPKPTFGTASEALLTLDKEHAHTPAPYSDRFIFAGPASMGKPDAFH